VKNNHVISFSFAENIPKSDVRKAQPIQEAYSLRGRTIIKSIIPETKFETLTFKHFFPRLLKTFKHFDFALRKDVFKTPMNPVNMHVNEQFLHACNMHVKHVRFYGQESILASVLGKPQQVAGTCKSLQDACLIRI
jgi:hypothetical protein